MRFHRKTKFFYKVSTENHGACPRGWSSLKYLPVDEYFNQAQLALDLFKKVSPSTCHWHVFVTMGLDPWMFTIKQSIINYLR